MRFRTGGFTLLEAIVALAILAAGGLALFAALNSAMRSIERVDASSRIDSAMQNALSRIDLVNPMLEPEGETDLGAVRMRWKSTPLEPPKQGLTDYLQPGYFDVGLYSLEVELLNGAEVERRFVVRKAGWAQVRVPEAL